MEPNGSTDGFLGSRVTIGARNVAEEYKGA